MSFDLTYTQSERASTPERVLWRAVVALAVKDSRNKQSEGHHEAIFWLTREENNDRDLVCDLADIDQGALLRWARSQYWDT